MNQSILNAFVNPAALNSIDPVQLIADGLTAGIPKAALLHPVQGLRTSDSVSITIANFVVFARTIVFTAVKQGATYHVPKNEGFKDYELSIAEFELFVRMVEEYAHTTISPQQTSVPNLCQQMTEENNLRYHKKVHRSWVTSRPFKGKLWRINVCEYERGGKKRYRHERIETEQPHEDRLDFLLQSVNVLELSSTFAQEQRANELLRTILPSVLWERYQVTGTIKAVGKSGVKYLLRKGRPTIAFLRGGGGTALCLHPHLYYQGTWTGSMTPTDEVIAHWLLIHNDEHRLWKVAGQHNISEPQSGI